MNKDGSNPVRDEAVVRAHAWAVRLWNERKISADFTSDDEAELVEMLLGFLAVAPYPEPAAGADFAALKDENYRLQSDKAILRQQLNEERFAVEALGGSVRVAEKERDDAWAGIDDLRRQLAEAQAIIADMRRDEYARVKEEYPPGRTAIIPPDVSGSTLPK